MEPPGRAASARWLSGVTTPWLAYPAIHPAGANGCREARLSGCQRALVINAVSHRCSQSVRHGYQASSVGGMCAPDRRSETLRSVALGLRVERPGGPPDRPPARRREVGVTQGGGSPTDAASGPWRGRPVTAIRDPPRLAITGIGIDCMASIGRRSTCTIMPTPRGAKVRSQRSAGRRPTAGYCQRRRLKPTLRRGPPAWRCSAAGLSDAMHCYAFDRLPRCFR